MAATRAGLAEIPVTVRDLDDRTAMEAALAENVQRRALSPIEEAEGYKRLLEEFGCTQERLSTVVGRSRPHIANMLRLLTLPEPVRHLVDDGSLSAGHARALLAAPDPTGLANRVVAEGMSVRRVERLVSERQNARRQQAAAKGRGTRWRSSRNWPTRSASGCRWRRRETAAASPCITSASTSSTTCWAVSGASPELIPAAVDRNR